MFTESHCVSGDAYRSSGLYQQGRAWRLARASLWISFIGILVTIIVAIVLVVVFDVWSISERNIHVNIQGDGPFNVTTNVVWYATWSIGKPRGETFDITSWQRYDYVNCYFGVMMTPLSGCTSTEVDKLSHLKVKSGRLCLILVVTCSDL